MNTTNCKHLNAQDRLKIAAQVVSESTESTLALALPFLLIALV